IFNWCMEGLRRLRQNGDFTKVQQIEDLTAQYRREANTLNSFIEDCCEVDPSYTVKSSEIYAEYKLWAERNGYKPFNNRNFKMEMERLRFYHKHTRAGKIFEGLKCKGPLFTP